MDVPCYYPEHDDCFARNRLHTGKILCKALTDADFGTRDCPFYKPRLQFEKEIREERRRRDAK